MSAQTQVYLDAIPQGTTHVFRCPCCREETVFFSTLSFIVLEQTSCQHCGREFVIENDRARSATGHSASTPPVC